MEVDSSCQTQSADIWFSTVSFYRCRFLTFDCVKNGFILDQTWVPTSWWVSDFKKIRNETNFSHSCAWIQWRTLIWYPLFLAAWTLTWSTAVSPLLLATRIRNQRFDLANHPYWINSFFIGIPLVFLTSLVVLSVFAQRAYSQYWAAYQGVRELSIEADQVMHRANEPLLTLFRNRNN